VAQGLYSEIEITPELEEEYIEKVAQKIHEYEMETAAILFLESSKPLVWVGGEMGRFFITPFVPILSDKWGETSEKFFRVFEKRENIEKLMNRLEQLAQEDEEKKQREKEERKTAKEAEAATEGEQPTEKSGWRKYLPF
jgi:ABC-type Zn2+ transport system substrate-binding protein/surface adhesin